MTRQDASLAVAWGLVSLVVGGSGILLAAREEATATKVLGYGMAGAGVLVAGSQLVDLFTGSTRGAPGIPPRAAAPPPAPLPPIVDLEVDEEL